MMVLNNKKIETNIINIDNDSILYIYDLSIDTDLTINIDDNKSLLVLDFNLNNIKLKVTMNQGNNTTVNYLHTTKVTDNYQFTYFANMNGNNNTNNIKIKGITSGIININVDGKVADNSKNNCLNEDVRILNLGGKVTVLPMMHINAKEVIANHNTAISNMDPDELLYLNSKGISNMGAITLIEDGYLYGMFKEYNEFYNLIKKG